MIEINNEMVMDRQDAIERCISLGRMFILDFDKIYNNQNGKNNICHWITEMTNWYNSVKEIRLKSNGVKLLNSQIHDWFLTAGSYPEDIIINPTRKELESYDLFWTKLINNNNVEESINEIFSIADNVQEFCKQDTNL